MGIFDVDSHELIKEVATDFKKKIVQPQWAIWVKSGQHTERAPQNPDWWFERAASILYRVYKEGPLGTESLRTYYGGRKNRGVKPQQRRKSGGKIIRVCLQQLEKEGLIKKGKKGRIITGKGQSYLNSMSKAVAKGEGMAQKVQKEKVQHSAEVTHAREALRAQEQRHKAQEKQKEEKK